MPPPEPQISPSIEVRKVSIREFCEHLGIEDYKRFIGLQHMHDSKMIWLLLENEEPMQTTGTAPQLASNTNYGKKGTAKTPKGKGGKRG
jgi:hypothetical protein